mgnify:CR=1 FL=1
MEYIYYTYDLYMQGWLDPIKTKNFQTKKNVLLF